jgi:hypothetical protein
MSNRLPAPLNDLSEKAMNPMFSLLPSSIETMVNTTKSINRFNIAKPVTHTFHLKRTDFIRHIELLVLKNRLYDDHKLNNTSTY